MQVPSNRQVLTIELAPGYNLEDYNDGNGGGLCCDLMIPGLPEGEEGDAGYVVDDRSRPYVELLFDEELPQEVVEKIEALEWVRCVYGSACP